MPIQTVEATKLPIGIDTHDALMKAEKIYNT